MSVKNTHPEYEASMPDVEMLRDFYLGERHVKLKGVTYLKPTVAQTIDGMSRNEKGWESYQKYIEGARFPDYVESAVDAMVGIMHKEDPSITVPKKMEPILESITKQGESIYSLFRRVNREQLSVGRLGLLLDVDERTNLPYIALYNSESLRNWDEGVLDSGAVSNIRLVVLAEPRSIIDPDLTWRYEDWYRVLMIQSPDGAGKPIYQTGLFQDGFAAEQLTTVSLTGNTLEQIPFVFINASDCLPSPDKPPLLGLANLVLGIYRSEANYRYHLYMQSQDTFVRIGYMGDREKSMRTGAGAVVDLEVGGDAKYIGVNSQGLAEERLALEKDHADAQQKALKLLDKKSSESGDALMTRKASQTASLTQIAKTSAHGIEIILKKMAVWMGADPDEVTVTPYTDFGDVTLAAKEVIDMMQAKTMGAPLSKESIHERMREGGITDKTLDDELIAMASEDDE